MDCAGTLSDISPLLCGLLQGDGQLSFEGISTDTRTISEGMLFLALRGENFDGNAFISQAFEGGAVGVVATELPPGRLGIRIEDPLLAYQALASWYRNQLPARIVAITGSCAKTSVKELLATIFESQGSSFKNQGNLLRSTNQFLLIIYLVITLAIVITDGPLFSTVTPLLIMPAITACCLLGEGWGTRWFILCAITLSIL